MKEGPTLLSGWTQNDYILWYHGFISKQYGRGQELIKKGTFPAGTDWKTEVEESVCCRKSFLTVSDMKARLPLERRTRKERSI